MLYPSVERAEFERLAPVLARSIPFTLGTHTLDDVWASIELGECQFWPGERSVIVTEVQDSPRKRNVHFFLAAGEMAEIEGMVRGIEAWAKHNGAQSVSLAGRHGWVRSFLARSGWKPQWTVMHKELLK